MLCRNASIIDGMSRFILKPEIQNEDLPGATLIHLPFLSVIG